MLSGGFRRSGLFGLIGVVVVAIVAAVIASSSGSGEANPKGTMALIFGVIAVFVVVLFVLQRSDLEKAAGGDAKAPEVGDLSGPARDVRAKIRELQQKGAITSVKTMAIGQERNVLQKIAINGPPIRIGTKLSKR